MRIHLLTWQMHLAKALLQVHSLRAHTYFEILKKFQATGPFYVNFHDDAPCSSNNLRSSPTRKMACEPEKSLPFSLRIVLRGEGNADFFTINNWNYEPLRVAILKNDQARLHSDSNFINITD